MTRVAVVFLVGTTFAHADYQQGLDAYMQGDFSRAQLLWRDASKQEKDARSMFNLGLLHQFDKVADASPEKADRWFQLAAEHGYIPAAHHLGVQMLTDRRGDGLAWIQKASDQGYLPAQRYLAKLNGVSVSGLSATKSKPLRSESWISKQPSEQWTIQLLAFNELPKVEAFVAEHDLHQRVAFFREPSRGVMFFKLVYGSYSSKDAALEARDSLPPNLKSHGPWLRSIADVKSAIAALEK